MADRFENTKFSNSRIHAASTANGVGHLLASAWTAFRRLANARTADELNALADRYQSGQPALAAKLRAAAVVIQAQGA